MQRKLLIKEIYAISVVLLVKQLTNEKTVARNNKKTSILKIVITTKSGK